MEGASPVGGVEEGVRKWRGFKCHIWVKPVGSIEEGLGRGGSLGCIVEFRQ